MGASVGRLEHRDRETHAVPDSEPLLSWCGFDADLATRAFSVLVPFETGWAETGWTSGNYESVGEIVLDGGLTMSSPSYGPGDYG